MTLILSFIGDIVTYLDHFSNYWVLDRSTVYLSSPKANNGVSNASLKRFLAQYKTMINKLIESIKLERLTPSIQVQQDHHHHTVLAKNARKDQRLTVLTESVDLYASCEKRLLGIK
jgi:hypothetical protein